MAIAFDAKSNGSASPGTSITFSHTCTGSNLILLVAIGAGGGSTDIITGVTYNGVALTRAVAQTGSGSISSYIYYLIAPATGAHDVVVSASSSKFFRATALSYTGAKQSSQPDGTNANSAVPGTSITTTITTTADNCWNISAIENESGLAMSASTGVNSVRDSIGTVFYVGDSNGPKTPAGSYSMTWTSSSQNLSACQISIAPVPGPVNIKSVNGLAIASIKSFNGLANASIKSINGLT